LKKLLVFKVSLLHMGCIICPGAASQGTDEVGSEKQIEVKYMMDIWQCFDFKKKLGQGATADVVLVSLKGTDMLYALKMVIKKKRHHFDRERKILFRLDCPNIIRINDAYEDRERFYFTMEYCSGKSLILRTAQRKKYTENVASETASMILKAVNYLHDMDIVHRDIKPENFVYLSEKDAALKMLDFGLAIEVPPDETFSYRAGTPYFMAPEVIKNNNRSADVCKKSDIWSVGICLYILLNGTAPFKGGNRDELFTAILRNPLTFKNGNLSSDAKDLLMKLCDKDPEKRITAAEALAHPWIMRGGQEEKELMLSTAEALGYMHTKHSLHRALEKVALDSIDKFDEKAMKELFDRYDENGDGNITKDEFVAALEERNIYRLKAIEIAQEILVRSDTNKDSMIQFDEFKIAMLRHQLTQNEYRMHAIFSALDANKDGKISIDELVHCLGDCDHELIQLIESRFSHADRDNDGELSFDEFTDLLKVDHSLRESTLRAISHDEDLIKRVDDNEQFVENLA